MLFVLQGNLQIHQVHVGQDGQVGTELSSEHLLTL